MSKHEKKKIKKKIRIDRIIILFMIIIVIVLFKKYQIISKAVLVFNPINIQDIEISIEKTKIELGESIDVKANIYPENYSKSDLQWHSSNEEIIGIVDGKITGKTVGKSTIYLTDNETRSNEIEVECLIEVKDALIQNPIEEIQLGNIHKLEVKILPEDATYKELQYESSNTAIANIDDNGNLIANAIGKSTIIIKDYRGKELNKFDIEVKKIPVKKIELDDTEITLGKGQSYIINAKITPLEATYNDVTWKSSDKNIVTIENRKIKAINEGTAKITATTDNGDKKAVCTVKVNKANPQNSKKFANGNYNIRTGNSTDYEILATTGKYEEIEFLQDTKEGWKKVRNSKGVVGYTFVKENYYLNEKPNDNVNIDSNTPNNVVISYHISNVPYLNQISLGYPTGCEAVSATMLLKYKGYNVSVKNIIDNTKCGSKKHQSNDETWYGANPFEEFVGQPSGGLSEGNYGVFAKPIANSMSVYAGEKVKNISGCSENTLFSYVSKGNPVVVWCVKNAGDLRNGVTWKYEDGSGSYQELVGEHCAVLIGYDEDYVYLNDPSAGQNVKQSKAKFISNWKKLYSQAIIIE